MLKIKSEWLKEFMQEYRCTMKSTHGNKEVDCFLPYVDFDKFADFLNKKLEPKYHYLEQHHADEGGWECD